MRTEFDIMGLDKKDFPQGLSKSSTISFNNHISTKKVDYW